MPLVGGKFYMNPAHGRAVERARQISTLPADVKSDDQESDVHWVTINHRHVLISERKGTQSEHDDGHNSSAAEYKAFIAAAKMPIDTSRIMLVTGVKADVPRTLFAPSAEVTLTVSDARTLKPVKVSPHEIQAVEFVAQGSGGPSSGVRDTKQFVDTITAGTTGGGVISQIVMESVWLQELRHRPGQL